MAKTIFDAADRQALLARIERLDPTAHPRWGKFTAPKMVSHLISAVRMALGEERAAPRASFLSNRVMRWFIIYVMPWPKGAPTAPEMLSRAPDSWADDLRLLAQLIERAAVNGRAGTWHPHPAFGDLSADDWGALVHRHVAHHLTQFGA
ncbi:MAG: DUF1569 domain-containing protein [Gemmatimonadota bacterium]|nr:DUF1569 domain-containing protein [Gemmatimonadota bacterium]